MTILNGIRSLLTRKRLANLGDWNAKRRAYWAASRDKVMHPERYGNGFECPECGGELYDTGHQLEVAPAILQVRCLCGYKGKRYD